MMYDDGTMMFYYFDEALDRVNELDILQKFEDSLEQSSIPKTYREIYKQKFYCPIGELLSGAKKQTATNFEILCIA